LKRSRRCWGNSWRFEEPDDGLPRCCCRTRARAVSVLDFDAFPETPAEQLSLVRFRVKKTIPFDIGVRLGGLLCATRRDEHGKGHGKGQGKGQGKTEVVAVTVAHEILAGMKRWFRNAGFHPGDVTVSALAVLNLYKGAGGGGAGKAGRKHSDGDGDGRGQAAVVSLPDAGKKPATKKSAGCCYPTFAYARMSWARRCAGWSCAGSSRLQRGCRAKANGCKAASASPARFNAGLLGYMEASAL